MEMTPALLETAGAPMEMAGAPMEMASRPRGDSLWTSILFGSCCVHFAPQIALKIDWESRPLSKSPL